MTQNQKNRKVAKNHSVKKAGIPRIFFIFFFVVVVVNVAYIYVSKKTWRGVAVKDAYQKGLSYNDTIEDSKRQSELGWKLQTVYERSGNSQDAVLKFFLTDRNGNAIKDAHFVITFKRPTQEGWDFIQTAKFSEATYIIDVHFPVKGQWDAEIVITSGDKTMTKKQRYILD